jgi:hypothetical protein
MEEAMADRAAGDDELRRRQSEILDETMRLLRADAQIMETVQEMIRVAGEEAARRPNVLFQAPRGEEFGEGEIIGGQFSVGTIFGAILDLVKEEKRFIQELIRKLFPF